MAWSIYPKQYKDKHGKVQLFYKILSKEGMIKKTIPNVKIKPEYFNKRTYQVNAKTESATAINEILTETTTLLNKGWAMYETGTIDWQELKSYMGGAKPNQDVKTFIETFLKDNNTPAVYNGIKDAYGAAKKVLGRDLTFQDFTLKQTDRIITHWKNEKRTATLKTYKYHLGLIINAAYEKKFTAYHYRPLKKWQKKKEKVNIDGNPYVTTARPEHFLQAIDRCTNMMHINGLGFWLYLFSMRGLYPTDLCVLHERKFDVYIDHPDWGDAAVIKHFRHKTNEPMWILYPMWLGDLQMKLRGYLETTHGYKTNTKTGKKYLQTPEYELSENNEEGWFFKRYIKDRWNTINKQCGKVGFPNLKTARKTFETVALTLEISQEVRDRLIGHEVKGVKKSYQDWEWDELQQKIHAAHEEILAQFRVHELVPALISKANDILIKKGVNVVSFNEKYKC